MLGAQLGQVLRHCHGVCLIVDPVQHASVLGVIEHSGVLACAELVDLERVEPAGRLGLVVDVVRATAHVDAALDVSGQLRVLCWRRSRWVVPGDRVVVLIAVEGAARGVQLADVVGWEGLGGCERKINDAGGLLGA